MKKILYVTVTAIGICRVGNAASPVSYHSLVEGENRQETIPSIVCPNEAKLQDLMKQNTLRFLSAPLLKKEKIAEELIPEYRKVFCTDEEDPSILTQVDGILEDEWVSSFTSEELLETVDYIASLCNGLPEAALKIQNMYEVMGNCWHSLVWALVSYRMGYAFANENIGRLLVGMWR